jgi:hypothetical protein
MASSNSDVQFETFPTGASGLAPAVIGYSEPNLQPLMTAMQQRMRNAQNARENELALQQMAMREKLAQDEMQLKRDQFAAEGPLRQAQIENYHALADYHNRMGKAQSDAIKSQWQYNASLAPQLAEYHDAMRDLNTRFDIGSNDWWTNRNAMENDFSELLSTDPGSKAQAAWDTRGQRASIALAQGHQRTADSLKNTWANYDVPETAIGTLQSAVDADEAKLAGYTPSQRIAYQRGYGGQLPTSSDVWGVNPNGSRFAYFPTTIDGKADPHAGPASLSAVNALDSDEITKKYRKVTIEAPQVESIVAASRALNPVLRGNGIAPQWAYSLRGGTKLGQPVQKPLDAGTAQTFLQQAGGDKNRARELAKAAGYTF